MSKLLQRIHDETIAFDYVITGDYYRLAIELLEDDDRSIGKWGGCTERIWKKQVPLSVQVTDVLQKNIGSS